MKSELTAKFMHDIFDAKDSEDVIHVGAPKQVICMSTTNGNITMNHIIIKRPGGFTV